MAIPNTPNYYGVQDPMFQKAMRNILDIQSVSTLPELFPAVVIQTTIDGLTASPHDYLTGLIVRLNIPQGFGMQQLNEVVGAITVVSETEFTLPIDVNNFDPFVVPDYLPGHFGTPATVIPVGQVNDSLIQSTMNVLPYP